MSAGDVLGIIPYKINGRQYFRVRGWGEDYAAFYEWLRPLKLAYVYTDFPWDHFRFEDPANDAVLREKWGVHIFSEDPDEVSDWKEPVYVSNPLEEEWAKILADAITEEINREVLAELKKKFGTKDDI